MSRAAPIIDELLTMLDRASHPRHPVNPQPLLLRCANSLEEAAMYTELGYPEKSAQFFWLAKLIRSHLARAQEDNQ